MQDYSFVRLSGDRDVNGSVISNPPQISALNAKSSHSFSFPGVTTATSRLQASSSCHQTAILQKTKVYFMEEHHSETEKPVSNKFALNITSVLRHWFSSIYFREEFFLRKIQIQRFLQESGLCCCNQGCRTEDSVEKLIADSAPT